MLLILPSFILTKESSIKIEMNCTLISRNEKECIYSCNAYSYYNDNKTENINLRMVVTHSSWTAIYDKTYQVKTNQNNIMNITIPIRNYNYILNANAYDRFNNIGALEKTKTIAC
jgi:hypothetical protein